MLSAAEMSAINERPAVPPMIAQMRAEAAAALRENPVSEVLLMQLDTSAIKGTITIPGQGFFDTVIYPGPILSTFAKATPPRVMSTTA